jgi:Zn-dependent protease
VAQLGTVLLFQVLYTADDVTVGYRLAEVCHMICYYLVVINLGLGIFNLIPVPPLDGSKVLTAILPARLYFRLMQWERYGFIVLIILINLPFFNSLLYSCENAILSFYNLLIGVLL